MEDVPSTEKWGHDIFSEHPGADSFLCQIFCSQSSQCQFYALSEDSCYLGQYEFNGTNPVVSNSTLHQIYISDGSLFSNGMEQYEHFVYDFLEYKALKFVIEYAPFPRRSNNA